MFSFDTNKIIIGKRAEMRRQIKQIQKLEGKSNIKTYWNYFMGVIKNGK